MKVHEYKTETSVEVYNLSQCSEAIKDGDILVVHTEKVVGILDGAWPVAITKEHGEFHTILDGYHDEYRFERYPEAVKKAEIICHMHGWPIGIEPPF